MHRPTGSRNPREDARGGRAGGRALARLAAAATGLGVLASGVQAAEIGRDDLTRLVAGSSGTAPADLTERNLGGLDLSGFDFKQADINGARFKGIKGRDAIIDLDTAKNLHAARFD